MKVRTVITARMSAIRPSSTRCSASRSDTEFPLGSFIGARPRHVRRGRFERQLVFGLFALTAASIMSLPISAFELRPYRLHGLHPASCWSGVELMDRGHARSGDLLLRVVVELVRRFRCWPWSPQPSPCQTVADVLRQAIPPLGVDQHHVVDHAVVGLGEVLLHLEELLRQMFDQVFSWPFDRAGLQRLIDLARRRASAALAPSASNCAARMSDCWMRNLRPLASAGTAAACWPTAASCRCASRRARDSPCLHRVQQRSGRPCRAGTDRPRRCHRTGTAGRTPAASW